MFLDKSRKPAGRKRRVACFLTLSLLLHAAVLVFLADSGRVQEEISRVEVGLVSLPPRIAAERTAPEGFSGGAKAPAAGEKISDRSPVSPAGKNVERNAADLSVAADPPRERSRSQSDAAGARAPLPGPEPPPAEPEPPTDSPAPAGNVADSLPEMTIAHVSVSEDDGDPGPVPDAGGKTAAASLPLIEAMPRYDRNSPPPYPRIARERGWEGEVLLRVLVSATGRVRNVAVERSSKHAVLDAAALGAVRRWRFHPSRLGATPVEGEVFVPLRFRLRDF